MPSKVKEFFQDIFLGIKSFFTAQKVSASDYELRLNNYVLERVKQISKLQSQQKKEIAYWQVQKEQIDSYQKMTLLNRPSIYISEQIREKIKVKEAKIEILEKSKNVLTNKEAKWRETAQSKDNQKIYDHLSSKRFKVYDSYKADFEKNINKSSYRASLIGTSFREFFNFFSIVSCQGGRTGTLLENINLDMKRNTCIDEKYQPKSDISKSIDRPFSSL